MSAGLRFDNKEQEYLTESSTYTDYVLPGLGGPFSVVDLGGISMDQAIFAINSQLAGLVSEVPETNSTEMLAAFYRMRVSHIYGMKTCQPTSSSEGAIVLVVQS